jgi:hypothetical protein
MPGICRRYRCDRLAVCSVDGKLTDHNGIPHGNQTLVDSDQKTQTLLDPAISQLYHDITPSEDSEWSSKEQIQNAPFRSTFHLTMGKRS